MKLKKKKKSNSYLAQPGLAYVLDSLIYGVQHNKLPRHGTSSTRERIAELVCTQSGVHFQCDSVPLATEGVRSTVSRPRRLTAMSQDESVQLTRETKVARTPELKDQSAGF